MSHPHSRIPQGEPQAVAVGERGNMLRNPQTDELFTSDGAGWRPVSLSLCDLWFPDGFPGHSGRRCGRCFFDPCRCPRRRGCDRCCCDPCECHRPCGKCHCRPCKCHHKRDTVKCDRGLPKDRAPNRLPKWKDKIGPHGKRERCVLGDAAITEDHSRTTFEGRRGLNSNAAQIRLETVPPLLGPTHYVGFRASGDLNESTVWRLPRQDGDPGQLLQTDGDPSNNGPRLNWADPCCKTAPIVNDDFICLRSGATVLRNLLANDHNVRVPVRIVNEPAQGYGPKHGQAPLVDTDSAVVRYTADRGYTGPDSFVYQATEDDEPPDVFTKQEATVFVNIVSQPPPPVDGQYRFIYAQEEGDRGVYEYNSGVFKPLFTPNAADIEGIPSNNTLKANGLATNRNDNLVYFCWRIDLPVAFFFATIFAYDYILDKQFVVAIISTRDHFFPDLNPDLFKPFQAVLAATAESDNPAPTSMGQSIGADYAFENGQRVLYLAGSQSNINVRAYGHYRIVLGTYDGTGVNGSQKIQSVTWVPWLNPSGDAVVGRQMGDLSYNALTGGLMITSDGDLGESDAGSNTVSEVDGCSGAEISPPKKMVFADEDEKKSHHQSTFDAAGSLIVSYKTPSDDFKVKTLSGGTGIVLPPDFLITTDGILDMAQWISQECDEEFRPPAAALADAPAPANAPADAPTG